jgi:hypothetical protein
MKTGFSVMRKDSVWVLRMDGSATEGKFGSLKAAMQCAYWLTDAAIGTSDCDAAAAGCSEIQFGG